MLDDRIALSSEISPVLPVSTVGAAACVTNHSIRVAW